MSVINDSKDYFYLGLQKCDEQNRRKALPANRQMGIEKA